jgi:lauroyl/myristoyl acyltransferase
MEFLHAVIGESVYIQDRECTLKIVRRLRSGGLVNIHFDGQSGTRTTPWSLLGIPRRFSTGIFELIRLSSCAVVPMICLGRSSAFRIIFGPMLDIVQAPGRDEFIRANLPAFVQTIEKQILDYPEEWEQWMSI